MDDDDVIEIPNDKDIINFLKEMRRRSDEEKLHQTESLPESNKTSEVQIWDQSRPLKCALLKAEHELRAILSAHEVQTTLPGETIQITLGKLSSTVMWLRNEVERIKNLP